MKISFTSFLLLLLMSSARLFSSTGDTINVITHDEVIVITDPSKGFNAYPVWKLFPDESIKYRKATLFITYQCPDSQRCGEWDYIDNIFLRRKGGIDTSMDIELARMISPYGSRFDADWKFQWKTDVTDFSFLLHDSVEIEFNHTGYESNTDRGWLITLNFELIEGPPAREVLGFEKLWNGSFPYGNDSDRIENYLTLHTFENDLNADIARVRILQTGHGMDDLENCAEFCSKYRKFYFDKKLIEQKQIWRECADNPLHPQAGTWIFDRAGWCPGAVVNPDVYDLKLNSDSNHTISIEMEPYINPIKPSANYVFSSYLFYYKEPLSGTDISIEEIIIPSKEDIYSGKNPSCMNAEIVIKNNGNVKINEMEIAYGIEGDPQQIIKDSTSIASGKSENIILPGLISSVPGMQRFNVVISIDGDEYLFDNSKTVEVNLPPVFDPKFVLLLRSNTDSTGNSYILRNSEGAIIKERNLGSLKSNFLYKDTFDLQPGCYELVVKDTANDGLDFWFNPEGGYGYVRIVGTDGELIRSFNSDFGSEIRQQFTVTGQKGVRGDASSMLNIFPPRNSGKFTTDIFLNFKQDVTLQITNEDKSKIVFEKKLKKFKDGMIDVDISKEPDGFYYVNLLTEQKIVSKRIKVKRD
ncbi:MAG: peptide-N-glycosidase F-related protein [bacterium]|nr:peptide-N-glycosidase F-related protein [bacterium]